MRRPPRELDELMWRLAEEDRSDAIAEFFERYPKWREELVKRRKMVIGMRRARPDHDEPRRFVPTPRSLEADRTRFVWRWAVAALALGTIFAVVAAVSYFQRLSEDAAIAEERSTSEPPELVTLPERVAPERGPVAVAPNPQPLELPPSVPRTPPMERPVTLRMDRIRLHDALRSVAAAAEFDVEIAPGTENPDVSVDYLDTPALVLMQDMGRSLGFTVLQQSEAIALVVPAPDPTDQTAPTGQTRPLLPAIEEDL